MSQQELVKEISAVLARLGIPFMLTGAVVSSMQGEPRSTHDIGAVVMITRENAAALSNAFRSPRYYLDEDSVIRAVAQKSMFNLLDVETGEKADFWILTEDPFDKSRFSRRETIHVFGVDMPVSRLEDTILMKLAWSRKSGGSEKQFTDALRVYEVQYGALDMTYMEHWAQALEVNDALDRIKREAKPVFPGEDA
ncbi:MAG: hypothetical protein HZB29_05345 [Nitrospinae bacterium]|nr:hypothetical protein [Nitrospinota bacterium]